MKRIVVLTIVSLAMTSAIFASRSAAESTWTGFISDSHCGAKPHAGVHHGKKVTDKQCIIGIEGDSTYKSCLAYGAKFVFVSGGTVFKVANQDHPGLTKYAADTIRLTGTLAGDTITVATIALASGNSD